MPKGHKYITQKCNDFTIIAHAVGARVIVDVQDLSHRLLFSTGGDDFIKTIIDAYAYCDCPSAPELHAALNYHRYEHAARRACSQLQGA